MTQWTEKNNRNKTKRRSIYIMNIGLIIFAIFGSLVGLLSTLYIVVSLFWILGYKIWRKVKHGTPLYD